MFGSLLTNNLIKTLVMLEHGFLYQCCRLSSTNFSLLLCIVGTKDARNFKNYDLPWELSNVGWFVLSVTFKKE